jgi:amino acid transporter
MPRHALIHRRHDADVERREDETVDRNRDGTVDDTRYDADERRPVTREHVVPVSPHDTYGGTNWGACFFGWLVALGVTVALAAIVSAIATAVGANLDWSRSDAENNADTIGLAAAIAITAIMFVGYYAGGYVAGRMSRFDAARQGLGVWLIGVLTAAIALGVTALFGTRNDLLKNLDLPSLDITHDQATIGAVVTGVAILLVMLVGALLGSVVGRRYHRRIDAVIVEH